MGKITDTYKISEIVKGEFATQNLIYSHLHHENFILLKKNFNIIPVAKKLKGKKIYFKVGNLSYRNYFPKQSRVIGLHKGIEKITDGYFNSSISLSVKPVNSIISSKGLFFLNIFFAPHLS